MKSKKTNRGFFLVDFYDFYEQPCSLQQSSIATTECIWLGVHTKIDLNTKQPIGENQRMHLSRKQVKKLLPYLKKFVKTGELE